MVNLNESVINIFDSTLSDMDKRLKYIDQVWDILQSSYESQGGLKGSSFKTKKDMLEIPFWKLDVVDDVVLCVLMFKFNKKDKFRKMVALGTNTNKQYTELAKKKFYNILKNEFKTSVMEVSGKLLSYVVRNFSDLVEKYKFTIEEAKEILGDDVLLFRIDDWTYERKIDTETYIKMMMGTKKLRY